MQRPARPVCALNLRGVYLRQTGGRTLRAQRCACGDERVASSCADRAPHWAQLATSQSQYFGWDYAAEGLLYGTLTAASEVAAGPRRGMFPPRSSWLVPVLLTPSSGLIADAGQWRWRSCQEHHVRSITPFPHPSGWSITARRRRSCCVRRVLGIRSGVASAGCARRRARASCGSPMPSVRSRESMVIGRGQRFVGT